MILCFNLLLRTYFPEDQIAKGIENLTNALDERGFLIMGEQVTFSVAQKRDDAHPGIVSERPEQERHRVHVQGGGRTERWHHGMQIPACPYAVKAVTSRCRPSGSAGCQRPLRRRLPIGCRSGP